MHAMFKVAHPEMESRTGCQSGRVFFSTQTGSHILYLPVWDILCELLAPLPK